MNLQEISQKVGIKENDILNVLLIIKQYSPTLSELVRKTNYSHGQVKRLVLLLKPNIFYTPGTSSRLSINKGGERLLDSKKSKNIKIDVKELLEFVKGVKDKMPTPKREYDQFYAKPETVVERIEKMAKEKDLQERKVVFLGDDDLTCLALAVTNLASEILVLEIDDAILEVIENVSRKYNLYVKTYKGDLKKAIPKEFVHKFDTVFTDPPYTENGFDIFLRRSLEITKENMLSSHYICYGTSTLSRERSLKIQKIIDSYNLFLREKIPSFNKYIKGAETVGNVSDLYIIEKTPQTKLGKSKKTTRIYTWE